MFVRTRKFDFWDVLIYEFDSKTTITLTLKKKIKCI